MPDMCISMILGLLGQQARQKAVRLSWLDVDVQCWVEGDFHTPNYSFRVCASSQEEAYQILIALAEKAKSVGVWPQTWEMFVGNDNIGSVQIND